MIVLEIQNVCDRLFLEPKNIEKIYELCLCFGSNQMKSLASNREVLFPTSLWNQRDAAVSRIARTKKLSRDGISGCNPNLAEATQICGKEWAACKKTFRKKTQFFDASSGHKFTKRNNIEY